MNTTEFKYYTSAAKNINNNKTNKNTKKHTKKTHTQTNKQVNKRTNKQKNTKTVELNNKYHNANVFAPEDCGHAICVQFTLLSLLPSSNILYFHYN